VFVRLAGVLRRLDTLHHKLVNFTARHLLGRSGKDHSLLGDNPLLLQMSVPESAFMRLLGEFRHRVLYDEHGWKLVVPFPSTCLLSGSPFAGVPKEDLPGLPGYDRIVPISTESLSSVHGREAAEIFLHPSVAVVLAANLKLNRVCSRVSSRRDLNCSNLVARCYHDNSLSIKMLQVQQNKTTIEWERFAVRYRSIIAHDQLITGRLWIFKQIDDVARHIATYLDANTEAALTPLQTGQVRET